MENINHPNHYNRDGAFECLDEMLYKYGFQKLSTFAELNVDKYRYRAADKSGTEDLKKSDFYMRLYICINELLDMYPNVSRFTYSVREIMDRAYAEEDDDE